MKPPATLSPELAARRLWTRVTLNARSPADTAAAANQLGLDLRSGLGRWIGEDGYRIMLERAVAQVVVAHPTIVTVASFAPNGTSTPVSRHVPHGPAIVGRGVTALVASLIDLLGRAIGPEMALTLIAHASVTRQPLTEPDSTRGTDG